MNVVGVATHVELRLAGFAGRVQGEDLETDEVVSIGDARGNGSVLDAFSGNLSSCQSAVPLNSSRRVLVLVREDAVLP